MDDICKYVICIAIIIIAVLSLISLIKLDKNPCNSSVKANFGYSVSNCDQKCRVGGLNYGDCMKRCAKGLVQAPHPDCASQGLNAWGKPCCGGLTSFSGPGGNVCLCSKGSTFDECVTADPDDCSAACYEACASNSEGSAEDPNCMNSCTAICPPPPSQ